MNIYSDNSDYPDIEVTDRDLFEFDAWINGKKITPQLLSRFKNKKDYQEFMTRYEEDHLTIHNDPAIIGNSNKTHVSNTNEKFYADRGNPKKKGKCPESGCVQKKKNGKWMVISNKTGKPWNAEYDTEEKAKAAIAAYHAQRGFSKVFSATTNSSFTTTVVPFDWNDPDFSKGDLIGSVIFSITYIHLFHLGTDSYPMHMALNDYYEKMPELVDSLAEHALSEESDLIFSNRILPGDCPIEYLEELLNYCKASGQMLFDASESSYQSQLDDILNLIESTLYKLKRLRMGYKIFSIKESSTGDTGSVVVKTTNPELLVELIELIKKGSDRSGLVEIVVRVGDNEETLYWKEDDSIDDIQIEVVKRVSSLKRFSKIKSDDEFRKYAHIVMKNAHKDSYSKELTDKVVDDLLKKYRGSSYGELIGRLTSGLGR